MTVKEAIKFLTKLDKQGHGDKELRVDMDFGGGWLVLDPSCDIEEDYVLLWSNQGYDE